MTNVYFIKAGDCVKIGKAKDVHKRLNKLQIGNHNLLEILLEIPMPDSFEAHKLEKKFHGFFYLYRVRGEWFKYASIINKVIETIKQDDGAKDVVTALEISHRFFTGKDI
jgi:hypothetical protein